jgi:hypothetical protein
MGADSGPHLLFSNCLTCRENKDMTRYRFTDGHCIDAATPEEFVTKMRNSSYCPGEDDADFMDLLSERGQKIGLDIRSENAIVFLTDLIATGIVGTEPTLDWN